MRRNNWKSDLEEQATDITIYSDGSATEGMTNGGAGVIITRGPATDPEIIDSLAAPTGSLCSSTQAELHAIEIATAWLHTNKETWRTAKICTDSRAAIDGIMKRGDTSVVIDKISKTLSYLSANNKKIHFTWVPGHSNIPGNEAADNKAKEGSTHNQNNIGWSHGSTMAVIKKKSSSPHAKTHLANPPLRQS